MIKFLHNLALFWVKNANFFAEFLDRSLKTAVYDQRILNANIAATYVRMYRAQTKPGAIVS
jgi:hypothetical protein